MQHFFCKYYGSYNSILYYQVKVLFLAFGYSRKKPNSESWRHGISRGIEERKCGNFRSQLKKKQNFQGCSSKNSCGIAMVLVFDLGISKGCYINLMNFSGWKLVFPGISKGKVANLKLGGRGISGNYILNRPPLFFFWNSPFLIGYSLPIKKKFWQLSCISMTGL